MTTYELGQEVAKLYVDLVFEGEATDAQLQRWGRVTRELARRDYAARSHGRECTCSECWHLYETWERAQRRRGGIDPADVTMP